MAPDQLLGLAREAIFLALALAAPVALAALLASLLVGVLGATTGIQEASLGFAPRLAAGVVALTLTAPLIVTELVRFFRVILTAVS
jgi:flagellar biosynthesis protein FliQ